MIAHRPVSASGGPIHPLFRFAMDFRLPEAVALLSQTPRTLRSLLGTLPPCWTDATEAPDTWSPTMVVAHLLCADRTNWIVRARIMLADGPHTPSQAQPRVFPRIDPDAQVREMRHIPLSDLLIQFAQARAVCLAQLESWQLGEAELRRTGEHPEFGTVTLAQLLATWTAHDLSHLAQIARVMATQYREAVGPWGAYLRVMRL